MRRLALITLIASVALALVLLAGATGRPAKASPTCPTDLRALAERECPGATFEVPASAEVGQWPVLSEVPGGPTGPRSVIPNPGDERVLVAAPLTTAAPSKWVARLAMHFPADAATVIGLCTGFFVNSTTVITAGHCTYDGDSGGFADSIVVIPGYDSAGIPANCPAVALLGVPPGNCPFGARSAVTWGASVGYKDNVPARACYDYGVITTPVFPMAGPFFGYGLPAAVGASETLQGYPGDKPQRQQWRDTNKVTNIRCPSDPPAPLVPGAPPLVSYDIDACGGQSGSPVYEPVPTPGAARQVVAIHAYGYTPSDPVCMRAGPETHRENVAVNGFYNPGEFIYEDLDGDGFVSTDDVRLTAVGGFLPLTVVACPADADCGFALIPFDPQEKHRDNIGVNRVYDPAEFIYWDTDDGGLVSTGDIRLTVVGGFAALSIVACPADADCDFALRAFGEPGISPCFAHRGAHPSAFAPAPRGTGDNCGVQLSAVKGSYDDWIVRTRSVGGTAEFRDQPGAPAEASGGSSPGDGVAPVAAAVAAAIVALGAGGWYVRRRTLR